MADIETLLAAMRALVEKLEDENAHLRKENAELWESVHEGQDAVTELRAMLERAQDAA